MSARFFFVRQPEHPDGWTVATVSNNPAGGFRVAWPYQEYDDDLDTIPTEWVEVHPPA